MAPAPTPFGIGFQPDRNCTVLGRDAAEAWAVRFGCCGREVVLSTRSLRRRAEKDRAAVARAQAPALCEACRNDANSLRAGRTPVPAEAAPVRDWPPPPSARQVPLGWRPR